MLNRICWIAVLLLLVGVPVAAADNGAVFRVATLRSGLQAIQAELAARPELFPVQTAELMPSRDDRRFLRQAWLAMLDHVIAFDNLNQELLDNYRAASGSERKPAFRVAYAGYLAQYRLTLDLLDLLERNPAVHTLLNEAVPELGLPAGSYARIKFRFLNVIRGADFARLDLIYAFYRADPQLILTAGLEADRRTLWAAGGGKGPQRTLENGVRIIQDALASGWFPVQKGVAEWMGDTKVWRPTTNLISPEQIATLHKQLLPGDIILVRREWYLSNIGLPGYWPHAALYVGTAAERAAYLDTAQVQDWVRRQGEQSGELERLLQIGAEQAYALGLVPQEEGHLPRVLEAISEGVSLTSLEHAAAGDSLVVLRPNLDKVAKARAIRRAFLYAGRPYDFEFDFRTDAALVCTELVFKGYETADGLRGLELPLTEVLNRPVVPANEFARLFDVEYESPQRQFELVAFLDGQERIGAARWSDLEAFRQSWRRPKWHLLVQKGE